nr:MAG: capsid protein [Cressdnaviricota sp.]
MAWSYRSRRMYSRSVRRSFRRRRLARPRYHRRYRRLRRAPKGTYSSVVTLTQDAEWTLFTPATESTGRTWKPFFFNPATVPGFLEYKATYSHFRILKARLYISRAIDGETGSTYNYLVVGSRPFAAVQTVTSSSASPLAFVPEQLETALRQTKWQKVRYPNTTKNVVSLGFYPYTIVQTFGPSSTGGTGNFWQRIWEGKRWMPLAWTRDRMGVNPAAGIAFYGPYVVVDSSTGEIPDPVLGQGTGTVQCTLRLSVQFKGQR